MLTIEFEESKTKDSFHSVNRNNTNKDPQLMHITTLATNCCSLQSDYFPRQRKACANTVVYQAQALKIETTQTRGA